MEKQKQLIIMKNLKIRSKELCVLRETYELLTETIQKKQSYQDFLEMVVLLAQDDIKNVQSFMNRILVLVEIRLFYKSQITKNNSTFNSSNILKKRTKTATDENTQLASDVETHHENTQKEVMKSLGTRDIHSMVKLIESFSS